MEMGSYPKNYIDYRNSLVRYLYYVADVFALNHNGLFVCAVAIAFFLRGV